MSEPSLLGFTRILLTHPHDGHPAGETCLDCIKQLREKAGTDE